MQTAFLPGLDAEEARAKDYSLVGRDTALAIERGLAEADWYTSPVPRDVMRDLLERRDGPAIRDTVLYFGLIARQRLRDLPALGVVVGSYYR